MTILIKQAKIIDPTSPYHQRVADIYIEDGIIRQIEDNIESTCDQFISVNGLHVSPGWMDLFADFSDPGYEFRETIATGIAAAAAGGFTDVCMIPNTKPAVDQKSVVEYIIQKSATLPVTVHPIGAITKNIEGRELAEMYDMKLSGAVAFSDGIMSLQSAGIMIKALQYVNSFNGLIIQLPDDKSINPNGIMNEGITSTLLGLAGRPQIAEETFVSRDCKLAAYAESKLHLTGISTAASLQHIKEAKEKQIAITCSATPYHIFFCDEDLSHYDSNLKVNPPLRNKEDRNALRDAIINGLIDCIASHHIPVDDDHKVLEFEYAKDGMIGLQTAYAAANTAIPNLPQEKWVEMFSINPRKILNIPVPTIAPGQAASLTLFDPEIEWTLNKEDIKSISKNSPFINKTLKGKSLGIIHNHQIVLQLL